MRLASHSDGRGRWSHSAATLMFLNLGVLRERHRGQHATVNSRPVRSLTVAVLIGRGGAAIRTPVAWESPRNLIDITLIIATTDISV